jgi:hypothetical protein
MPALSLAPLRALALLALLAGCAADGTQLDPPRPELGVFRLSHNIALAGDATVGPLSRTVDAAAWEAALRDEVERRLGAARYDGDRFYHLAINVDGYVLAVPGIPLVVAPRSVLVIGVFLWDDALGRPLNEERKVFNVFESAGAATVMGSGLTSTAEEQMAVLVRNAVLQIEGWLAENPAWFDHPRRDGAAVAPQVSAATVPGAPAPAPRP